MTFEVTGPVLRWYGGKWLLAPWIISHFPDHRVYVEPFGGAASVLLTKSRSSIEIYNDLNSDVVNLFMILRDPEAAAKLIRLLDLTPFARDEYVLSHEESDNPIESARRFVVRSFMGFGGDGGRSPLGYRGFRSKNGEVSSAAGSWQAYPQRLPSFVNRLKGIVIENRDACDCILQHDSPATLHYIDPPYQPDERKDVRMRDRGYKDELTSEDHVKLLERLCQLKGMVVLSGYHSEVYDAALPGWRRVEKVTYDNRAQSRTEVLWINPAAVAARDQNLQSRFALIKP